MRSKHFAERLDVIELKIMWNGFCFFVVCRHFPASHPLRLAKHLSILYSHSQLKSKSLTHLDRIQPQINIASSSSKVKSNSNPLITDFPRQLLKRLWTSGS